MIMAVNPKSLSTVTVISRKDVLEEVSTRALQLANFFY